MRSPDHRNDEFNLDGFVCTQCKGWHPGLPLDWAFDAPHHWDQMPEAERSSRGHLNLDFCSIDDQDFFVRSLIEIPIIGSEERFYWGVWVSLSRQNFQRTMELWDSPKRLEEPPYFGRLSNNISVYPDTLNLKATVSAKELEWRPFIELEPTDHPLAVEQRTGITVPRVIEIATGMMHKNTG
jgi:hypothetical protein